MRRAWLASAATALAIIACYGTTLAVGALSLLGVAVILDDRLWAGAISAFAALAALVIAIGSWRRRNANPALVAGLGLALILWTMYGAYSRVTELVGFALLVIATLLDARTRAYMGAPPP